MLKHAGQLGGLNFCEFALIGTIKNIAEEAAGEKSDQRVLIQQAGLN